MPAYSCKAVPYHGSTEELVPLIFCRQMAWCSALAPLRLASGMIEGDRDVAFVCCAGFSNLASGLAGAGFTGSYIFSQTVFSMRAGVLSRLNGSVVAVLELLLFLAPKSVGGSHI